MPVPWLCKAEGVLAFITTEALRRLLKREPTLDWERLNANSTVTCKPTRWLGLLIRAGGPRVTVVSLGKLFSMIVAPSSPLIQ